MHFDTPSLLFFFVSSPSHRLVSSFFSQHRGFRFLHPAGHVSADGCVLDAARRFLARTLGRLGADGGDRLSSHGDEHPLLPLASSFPAGEHVLPFPHAHPPFVADTRRANATTALPGLGLFHALFNLPAVSQRGLCLPRLSLSWHRESVFPVYSFLDSGLLDWNALFSPQFHLPQPRGRTLGAIDALLVLRGIRRVGKPSGLSACGVALSLLVPPAGL